MAVSLPIPSVGPPPDTYGHARMPASASAPQRIDRIPYGRFRNVYVYITEACQLRCSGCYMGERLERALKMPFEQIETTLTLWRQMGGSKPTILGGEPTLHPRYEDTIRLANALGYEHVITTSNGLAKANRKFRRLQPADFAYVQISVDGGSAETHDAVRGAGRFDETLATMKELCERGFDTRIICTVSKGVFESERGWDQQRPLRPQGDLACSSHLAHAQVLRVGRYPHHPTQHIRQTS